MDSSDRTFEYKKGFSTVLLLGLLMLILGPLYLMTSRQAGPDTGYTFGHYLAFVPAPIRPYANFALLMLVGGAMFFGGLRSQSKRFYVRFTPDKLRFTDPASGESGRGFHYHQIKDIVIAEAKRGKTLTFRHPAGTFTLPSRLMSSLADFEALCTLLQERVSTAISA